MMRERKVPRKETTLKPDTDQKILSYPDIKPSILLLIVVLLNIWGRTVNAQDSSSLEINNTPQIHNSVQELQMMVERNIAQLNPITSYDTTFVRTKPRLLPQNMSFAENFLWGENGFFRKVGIASELTPEVRKHELEVRRTMLTAHQIGGFATLGLMLATVYYGQKVIDGQKQLGDTHQTLAGLTISSYTLTGLLAILTPPPLIRRDEEESTTTIHKTLAWLHVAGMIITPILASYIGEHKSFNIDKAHVHQVAGYITTALFATSLIVVTF